MIELRMIWIRLKIQRCTSVSSTSRVAKLRFLLIKFWREKRLSCTHDRSISRPFNLAERRFRRMDERRYLVTNRPAFRLFALKTVMGRSASPCPRNWEPEELTVAKVNSMPASLSRTVVAYPEGHGVRWKKCEFPEKLLSLRPKSFRSYRWEFPFLL